MGFRPARRWSPRATWAVFTRALMLRTRSPAVTLVRILVGGALAIVLYNAERFLAFDVPAPGRFLMDTLFWAAADLLTPAVFVTALGAIREERAQRTFGLLLMTGLGHVGMVLAKAGARLAETLLLLALTLPLALTAAALGGVSPGDVVMDYLLLAAWLTVVVACAVYASVVTSTAVGGFLLGGCMVAMAVIPFVILDGHAVVAALAAALGAAWLFQAAAGNLAAGYDDDEPDSVWMPPGAGTVAEARASLAEATAAGGRFVGTAPVGALPDGPAPAAEAAPVMPAPAAPSDRDAPAPARKRPVPGGEGGRLDPASHFAERPTVMAEFRRPPAGLAAIRWKELTFRAGTDTVVGIAVVLSAIDFLIAASGGLGVALMLAFEGLGAWLVFSAAHACANVVMGEIRGRTLDDLRMLPFPLIAVVGTKLAALARAHAVLAASTLATGILAHLCVLFSGAPVTLLPYVLAPPLLACTWLFCAVLAFLLPEVGAGLVALLGVGVVFAAHVLFLVLTNGSWVGLFACDVVACVGLAALFAQLVAALERS
jgi:hypothetical protein